MGLGRQPWVYTLKPRKFMGKRSKPEGGGESCAGIVIREYFQLDKRAPTPIRKQEYPLAYRKKLLHKLLL